MDLRVLYNNIGEKSPDVYSFFSNLIQSHRKYFNEILYLRIEKINDEQMSYDLLFGLTSRKENLPQPNNAEIRDILEHLLLLDFKGQGYMFLSYKKSTEFDAAVLVHENEEAYYIAFFNETELSYDEVGVSDEELERVFTNLTLITRAKLCQYL